MFRQVKRWAFLFVSHLLHGRTHFLFTLLIAFLFSVGAARLLGIFSPWQLQIAGYHIHHFYTGIILISIGAIALLLLEPEESGRTHERKKLFLSRMIGVGLGLVVDEVGLLLSCTTDGLLCEYTYGDLGSMISVVFWILISLIILLEFPHSWLLKIRSYLSVLFREHNQYP